MDTDLDKLFRYISLGAAAVVTVFFVILGIIQGEFILGLVWAAVASLALWILIMIAKRVLLFVRSKRGTAAFKAEVPENGEA